jgi:hypothetical protein
MFIRLWEGFIIKISPAEDLKMLIKTVSAPGYRLE